MTLVDQDLVPGLDSVYNQGFVSWLAKLLFYGYILTLHYFPG